VFFTRAKFFSFFMMKLFFLLFEVSPSLIIIPQTRQLFQSEKKVRKNQRSPFHSARSFEEEENSVDRVLSLSFSPSLLCVSVLSSSLCFLFLPFHAAHTKRGKKGANVFLILSLPSTYTHTERRNGRRSNPSGHRGRRRPSRPEVANRRVVQTKVRGVFEGVRGVCGTHRRRRNWGETLHGAVFRLLVVRGPLRGWTDDEAHELN
jgi:hypothetical protein